MEAENLAFENLIGSCGPKLPTFDDLMRFKSSSIIFVSVV
jgi:hypothetical protein